MTCALPILVSRGFIGRASIAVLVAAQVLLPSAKPALLDTLRLTLGFAWTYLVVAELVAANSGLGYAILKAQRFLQTDKIFAGIILIGLIGLLTDQAFRWLHRKAFPWAHLKH
jgi:NitT/TauT family transport system permease protein